jgi:osmotically-inducible protein OsmY
MRTRFLVLAIILGGITHLQACAPVIVAGGATAAVAATDRRTLGALVDDNAIELKARKALNSDPEIGDDVHVNITSMNGIVLLTGETTTAELRDRVLGLIRDIPGIRSIVNEVRVAEPRAFAYTTHDGWITGKVKAKLLGDQNIPGRQIKVVTENSVVYLMGLVKQKEGELAAEATRTVGGITRVVKLFEYLD